MGRVCVVARIKRELECIRKALEEAQVAVFQIQADGSDRGRPEAVRVATMHRVKGLEFDRVVLASINEGLVPLAAAVKNKGDPVETRQAELEERSLLYVAVTRAKKEAYVLSYGKESSYLRGPG